MSSVAIVGGGIGGLCTAVALRRYGIEATVYEAAPVLQPVGAGIGVPANAMQVLDRLGLADEVIASGMPLDRGEIREQSGTTLQVIEFEPIRQRFGQQLVAIHRGTLQQILAHALPPAAIVTGKAYTGMDLEKDSARLSFQDGTEVSADAVVAADGLHSVVRRFVAPRARLRYAGQTSYRGVCSIRLPSALQRMAVETWGPAGRIGFLPINAAEVYWYAVIEAPPGGRDHPSTVLPKLQHLAASLNVPVPGLIPATPEETIIRTDLWDLKPLARWWSGRAILLGDAAHATTPNLGQGGAQAIEDALALATCMAAHGINEVAFGAYQNLRMRKARQIASRSWWLGKAAHLRTPFARGLRNALLRHVPASVSQRQLDAMFALNF